VGPMSPHGDLIQAAILLSWPWLLTALYYVYLRRVAFGEAVRHNRAVERANWRLYWQIRRLGDCDGRER